MKLSEYLKKNKITQVAFAKRVGTSGPHINRISKGMTPSITLMKRIEKATNRKVKIEDLINKEPRSRLKSEFME